MSFLRPLRRADRKPDTAYISWLHSQPCVAFDARRIATGLLDISPCQGRITAHHAGDHGFGQRADDRTAISLCEWHHLHGPHAIHGKLGKNWWTFMGLVRGHVILGLRAKYEAETGKGVGVLELREAL